jgi:hypothetical protein
MQTYVLNELTIINSNFLEDLVISFESKFTLIQGPNCSGKTSIFNAMKTGFWTYKGQEGHIDLTYKHNSLELEYLDLVYFDSEPKNLFGKIVYKNFLSSDDFQSLLKSNLESVNNHLYKNFDLKETLNLELFFSRDILATGEQFIIHLCLIKTLREYIGVSGSFIMDSGPLSILDVAYRHLAIKILSSISDQLIIFEGNWWCDFSNEFELSNLNLINLKVNK